MYKDNKALTDTEREKVQSALVAYGMHPDTAYGRVVRRDPSHRFEPWEERGVFRCVEEYTGKTIAELSPMNTWYDRLERKTEFCNHMRDLGLGKNTLIKRFRAWDFQAWELLGVNNIV